MKKSSSIHRRTGSQNGSTSTIRAKKKSNLRASEKFVVDLPMTAAERRHANFDEVIRSIPAGKVATYGQIAAAAGYPRGHRQVARFLVDGSLGDLPWQRVVGAGGELKTQGSDAKKQRALLKAEGVSWVGQHIDMDRHGHVFDR